MSDLVELKEYMQDIEQKLDKANDRGIRTETKLDNILQWKDHHEDQDSHRFDKQEEKLNAVITEISNEMDKIKDEMHQTKLETLGTLSAIRKEITNHHNVIMDKISANTSRLAWIMGAAVGISFAISLVVKFVA